MILHYIWNKIPEENKGDIVFSLVFGLAPSLASGLVFGLVFGLVLSLASGLVFGLVDIVITSFQQALIILFIILVISEILYWLNKHKLEDESRWMNTLVKKGEALLETSLIVVNIRNVIVYYDDAIAFFQIQGETIHTVLCVIGYGTVIVLCIIGYIWFNSLKYKEKPVKEIKRKLGRPKGSKNKKR